MGVFGGAGGGVGLEGAVGGDVPVQAKLLALPGLRQIAHGEIGHHMLPVELAGEQVGDPVHAAGVVHMAVAVQVGEADGAAALGAQGAEDQAGGGGQLPGPVGTGQDDAALAGGNHAAGVPIHQHPQGHAAEHLVALGVVGHHAAGERGVGGGQGPGLHPDGLPPHGHAGDLHPVPGDRPEQLTAGQGIVIQLQQLTVPPAHFLHDIQDHGGLHPPVAVHKGIADGKILNINRFHEIKTSL